ALAPFAVRYFSEPRVQGVLWVLSICICAAGFGNIGLTLARKQFSFAIDYKANVYGKLIGVLATIVAGFYFRDYRGLVAGIASGYLAGLILSYALHPYRPAWNVSKIAEIWQITKWLMMAGISGFILRKGDELIAGRIGGSGEFGRYNVGADLGQTPVGEVGPAMLRAFLPVLASINGTTSEVNYAVLKTIAVVNSIVIPLGLGFSALALPVTGLFLGPHWSGAAKYAAAFGVISVLQVILSPCNTLLVYCGATKVQNSVVWLEFFAFVVAAFLLVGQWGLLGLAFARIVSSLVNCIATVFVVRRYCQFDTYHLINAVGRPLLGAVLMYALITQIIVPQVEGMLLTVALSVMAGSVFYMIWSALSWWFTGKQPGLESTIYGYFQSRRS
ncbi:MAG: polysaccharide biosynthesis protein, partial [Alphaproteobacteria bacterium]|nr:polysaccharide biosynthesis protein [Alphaproteobacteria bacterium]